MLGVYLTREQTLTNRNKDDTSGDRSDMCEVGVKTRVVLTKVASARRAECLTYVVVVLWHVRYNCRLVWKAQLISGILVRCSG